MHKSGFILYNIRMKRFKIKRLDGESAPKRYAIDYKAELNPEQYKAATHLDGPHLVIAGAGSGKTRTLIYRVAYLVENRIDPRSILLMTFTRKSAQEMMRRSAAMLDNRCKHVAGGTFHSFANLTLRKYALNLGWYPTFTIVDRGDAEDIINLIRAQLELNKKERRFPRKSTLVNIISKSINKDIPISTVVEIEYPHFFDDCEDIEKVADSYRDFKKQKQVMDYDDLLVYLKQLLETDEEVRKKLSGTYKYIMVDEYQDTNRLQAEIAYLLASEHQNLMVVGDDSQSIYAFRGANFRNIMDFPKRYPEAAVTTLEQNYRSTRPILDLTNAVIRRAKEKYSKELFSEIQGEDKPVFLNTLDEREQAAFIVQQVLDLREEGVPLGQIAVLFRAGWHSNELEIELKSANIPFTKYGGLKFAEAAHIKDVMSYLRVLYNPLDEIAWIRLLLLIGGIGSVSASAVAGKIIEAGGKIDGLVHDDFMSKRFFPHLQELHTLLSRLTGPDFKPAEKLEAIIRYYTPMFQKKYDNHHRRLEDLQSLHRISERYGTEEEMLTDMALEPPTMFQEGAEAGDTEDEKLVLSTIHSSKGLEWHSVFMIHLVDGYFPAAQAMFNEEQLEEERRLFYVAATRAKQNLYLVTPELEARGRHFYYESRDMALAEPSRFITELPDFDQLAEIAILEFEDPNEPF